MTVLEINRYCIRLIKQNIIQLTSKASLVFLIARINKPLESNTTSQPSDWDGDKSRRHTIFKAVYILRIPSWQTFSVLMRLLCENWIWISGNLKIAWCMWIAASNLNNFLVVIEPIEFITAFRRIKM